MNRLESSPVVVIDKLPDGALEKTKIAINSLLKGEEVRSVIPLSPLTEKLGGIAFLAEKIENLDNNPNNENCHKEAGATLSGYLVAAEFNSDPDPHYSTRMESGAALAITLSKSSSSDTPNAVVSGITPNFAEKATDLLEKYTCDSTPQ